MTSKTGSIASNQPVLGGIVGAVLTYWLASYPSEGSKLLLAVITPITVGVDRLSFRLFQHYMSKLSKKATQENYASALATLDSELNSPHLLPAQKTELQDLRLVLLKGKIGNMAFNQPPPDAPKSNAASRRKKVES